MQIKLRIIKNKSGVVLHFRASKVYSMMNINIDQANFSHKFSYFVEGDRVPPAVYISQSIRIDGDYSCQRLFIA